MRPVKPAGPVEMLANAAAAAGRAADAVLSGRKLLAVDPLAQQRTAICAACPQLRMGRRCAACGCIVGVKVLLDTERCPLGKW